ncbi:MAG: hypothetical protein ACI9MR_002251, partial [Myxococcota bacterium]
MRCPALGHLALILALPMVSLACDDFDPPPEATLIQPDVGFWTSDDALTLTFTEPIEPASLVLTIWPNDRDIEGVLSEGVAPLIDACTLATAPCSGLGMTLDETGMIVTIDQGEVFADNEGVPFILDVHPGLSDLAGRSRNVHTFFDFQINPACGNEPTDIDLQTATMSLTADLQVLPINLQMYLDMTIQADNGRVLVIGTFARLITDAPANTADPADFRLELDPTAWAVVFEGCLVEQAPGEYFFVSEPFDISITVLQSILVTLTDFKVQGTIKPSADSGRDTGSGTMSTSGGSFGTKDSEPTEVDPI